MQEILTAARFGIFYAGDRRFGENSRILAGMALSPEMLRPRTLTGPYGTFGMEPASLKFAI